MRRTLWILLALLLWQFAPVNAQAVDTATVEVARELASVDIEPNHFRGRPGGSVEFTATGYDTEGAEIPIVVEWYDTEGILAFETLGPARARATILEGTQGRSTKVSVTVLEADSVRIAWLPVDQLEGTWSELSWAPPPKLRVWMDTTTVPATVVHREQMQLCAYAWVDGEIRYMSSGEGCPAPASALGALPRLPFTSLVRIHSG